MTQSYRHNSGGKDGRGGHKEGTSPSGGASISRHYDGDRRRRDQYEELIRYSRTKTEGKADGERPVSNSAREEARVNSTRVSKGKDESVYGAAERSYEYRTTTHRKKKKKLTLRRLLKKTGQACSRGLRAGAKGLYRGYAFLMKLPKKTLLIGGGALGTLIIAVIILAVALPKKSAVSGTTLEGMGGNLAAASLTASDQTEARQQTEDVIADGTADSTPDETGSGDVEGAAPEGEQQTGGFTTELKSGDDDPLISEVQTRLMELGYMDSDEPTEHFGPLTKSALTTFQRHNGLDDDGILGAGTYALLNSKEAKIYVMQLGDSGPDVEGVQQRLYELGYLDNKANVTATFGEKTEEAAKAFQKKNKLTADGKVGVKTISLLYEEDVVSNAYSLGDENQVIKDCQSALKKLGYVTFKPDGVMGKTTVSAIKAFQRANGLTVDGALGPNTRDMILSGDAQAMVLQLGDYGTDVKNMQSYLVKLKYLKSANATGYFGAITEEAIKYFQKRNSLSADGKVGGVTLSIMKSTKAKAAPSSYLSSQSAESSSGSSGSSSGSSSSGSGSSSGSSGSAVSGTGVEKMVALAESKLGSKYIRGAKGPNTFDCSGFVYWCMKNAGLSASYMTSIMWRTTGRYTKISSMSSLQRGDILVFSGDTDSSGHVGIYLGSGAMIDASSSEGQVRRSSSVLKSGGYWSKHFLMGYRVF